VAEDCKYSDQIDEVIYLLWREKVSRLLVFIDGCQVFAVDLSHRLAYRVLLPSHLAGVKPKLCLIDLFHFIYH